MPDYKYNVILISGKQGSGKSTLQQALLLKFPRSIAAKFAGPLYELAELVYEHLNKKYLIGLQTDQAPFKRLLQVVGVEWGRDAVGEEIWVKCAQNLVDKSKDYPNALFIFDDCRFENEFRAFPNALKIRLKASEQERESRADRWRKQTNHPSETGLDHIADEEFDFCFDTSANSGGVDAMVAKIEAALLGNYAARLEGMG